MEAAKQHADYYESINHPNPISSGTYVDKTHRRTNDSLQMQNNASDPDFGSGKN